MIRPNELRIGNYIQILGSPEYLEVWEIHRDLIYLRNPRDKDVLHYNTKQRQLKGIELTGQLVQNCGLRAENEPAWQTLDPIKLHEDGNSWYLQLGDRNINKHPIDHLHQLQNAYFLFTGKELKLAF